MEGGGGAVVSEASWIVAIISVVRDDYRGLYKKMKNYNQLEIRCPRLGGEVKFFYCAVEGGDLPCSRIVDCWQAFFPVEAYLRGRMSQEAWERFSRQIPKDKVSTLIELIEAAKKRVKPDDQG
jgi:hypothetical protein